MEYYLLTIIALIITLASEIFVKSTYKKYLKVKNFRNLTGSEAARMLLDNNGLSNVTVSMVNGYLSDHYDPSKKVVNLSNEVFNGNTISSVAVACHECGHAIQDKENYYYMRLRAKLVPLVRFCSYSGYVAIVIGCILSSFNLIVIGIIAECVILLFQLVTLPVEFDASKKALKQIEVNGILNDSELSKGKKVLKAAAMTYVASVADSMLQILRLLLMFSRRRN